MVTYAATRFGQINAAGDERALFLKRWAGEVLLGFKQSTVTDGKVVTKTIDSGKSAQFPLIGSARAGFHIPGQDIIEEGGATPTYLSKPRQNEKIISIDGFMTSSVLVPFIDDAMSHWDTHGPYGRELGQALALEYDIRTLMTMVVGASKAAPLTKDAYGNHGEWTTARTRRIVKANFMTSAEDAVDAITDIATRMDQDEVPESGRFCAIPPTVYRKLARHANDVYDPAVASAVVANEAHLGTGANLGTGMVKQIQGITLLKTNRIIGGNDTTPANGTPNLAALGDGYVDSHAESHGTDYSGDYASVRAVAWQKDTAVGIVKLRDLQFETERQLRLMSDLMVGFYSVGHGVLHEKSCYCVSKL